MPRSTLFFSRRSSYCVLRRAFCFVVMLVAAALAACGNSCFAGFSNNGNGVIIIKAGNPPPPCSLTQVNGMVRIVALKPAICESCSTTGSPQHLFVTLQHIQLHSTTIPDPDSPDWLDIAPELTDAPLQIDLLGGASPQTLLDSVPVSAGVYHQVRLQFLADSAVDTVPLLPANACGAMHHNCIVMADGRIEPLAWPTGTPEVLFTQVTTKDGSLVVRPEVTTDLRLSLEPDQIFSSSNGEPLKLRTFLTGRASAAPPSSPERADRPISQP